MEGVDKRQSQGYMTMKDISKKSEMCMDEGKYSSKWEHKKRESPTLLYFTCSIIEGMIV